ncbi:purine permease 7 [Dorcoceras hygrometricum]|uniref:Purine permease 7 n=1 Tax=Dorcoceras hygrometricum TaxID=472368 RepID=A0A2Z7C6C7_9LAMI|nr:purine permease 7 [Dorcoceras hygrometricum]
MMNSRRICPVDGSQYKDSAVGLVFMESAAELAMETSKVESAVRNQAEAKLNQLEHNSADALCVEDPAVARYQLEAYVLYQLDNQTKATAASSISSRRKTRRKEFSRSDKSAAKQLTIYESWMSTTELNSNGENDKKPAKERTQVLFPVDEEKQLRRCARYGISCDDISLDVITISSWLSADEEKTKEMKRRHAEESADGLALMTSSVTKTRRKEFSRSDKSAVKQLTIYESWMSTAELNSNGENDKKPAKEKDARVLTAAGCGIGSVHEVVRSNLLVEPSEVEEGEISAFTLVAAVVHLWCLGVLTAAGCGIGSVHEVVRSNLLVEPSEVEEGEMKTRRKEFSRSDKSAAKQLTIYESWMSTAELNSNGENDKKPAKEKDASTISCRYFTRHISNGKKLCPTGRNLNRGLYTSRAPLKKVDE